MGGAKPWGVITFRGVDLDVCSIKWPSFISGVVWGITVPVGDNGSLDSCGVVFLLYFH